MISSDVLTYFHDNTNSDLKTNNKTQFVFFAKKRRFGKKLADREMRMLDLYCGLKISDSKYGREETTEA